MRQSVAVVGSLDKVNSFFQQAINQKHSIYQSNDVLSLLVSKVMVAGQDTYHDIVTGKQIGRASCRERVSSPV